MDRNFARALSAVLKHEGGYVDHPSDPGGATNLGITFAVLQKWRGKPITKADVKALTQDEAAAIYRANYWDRVKGDDLPPGVDYCVFDFAVNSGVSRSAIYLQEIVGVAPDGKIGPLTVLAVADWDSVTLIESLCGKRMSFLKKLSTWPVFGKGWSARVTGVLRLAKDMAITMPNPQAPKPAAPRIPAPETRKSPLAILAGFLIAILVAGYALLKSKGVPLP